MALVLYHTRWPLEPFKVPHCILLTWRGPTGLSESLKVGGVMARLFITIVAIVLASLVLLFVAGKYLTNAQVFAVAFVAIVALVVAWLLIARRYYRLRAIVAMVCVPIALPGFKLLGEQFGVTVTLDGLRWPAVVLAGVGVTVMGFLEWQANHNHIVGATLKGIAGYLKLIGSGASARERQQCLEALEDDPDIDAAAFRMIAVIELANRSRQELQSPEDEGSAGTDDPEV